VQSSIPDDADSERLGKTAYNWIQTWFWSIESNDEFDHSLKHFWKWLQMTDDSFPSFTSAKLAIRDFVMKSLLPKREYWLRSLRIKQLSFDAKTTSVVEGQNVSIKKGCAAVAPNCSLAKATDIMLRKSELSRSVKKITNAKAISATPLWTLSATSGCLTSFAEMIVSCNYDKRSDYVGVQIAHNKWVIVYRQHLYEDGNSNNDPVDPIPKFQRMHNVELVGGKFLCCDCFFFNRMLLPCSHVLYVVGQLTPQLCHIRWHKSYMFHWEKSEEITMLLKHLSATVAVSVPAEGTKFFDNIYNYIGDVNFTTPQKLWDTSDYEFTKLLAIRRHLKGNSHTSIACIDVQEEDSSPSDEDHSQSEHGSLLLQEAVLSPMRML
jgi:hypothetical protein